MGLLVDDAKVDKKSAAAALFATPATADGPAAPASRKRKASEPAAQPEASGGAKKKSSAEREKSAEGSSSSRARADPEVDEAEAIPAVPGDHKRVGEKPKQKRAVKEDEPERLARTVFVGNVPTEVDREKLAKHFAYYGKVVSVRIRSAAAANPKMPQKAVVIKKDYDAAVKVRARVAQQSARAPVPNRTTQARIRPQPSRPTSHGSACARTTGLDQRVRRLRLCPRGRDGRRRQRRARLRSAPADRFCRTHRQQHEGQVGRQPLRLPGQPTV